MSLMITDLTCVPPSTTGSLRGKGKTKTVLSNMV